MAPVLDLSLHGPDGTKMVFAMEQVLNWLELSMCVVFEARILTPEAIAPQVVCLRIELCCWGWLKPDGEIRSVGSDTGGSVLRPAEC